MTIQNRSIDSKMQMKTTIDTWLSIDCDWAKEVVWRLSSHPYPYCAKKSSVVACKKRQCIHEKKKDNSNKRCEEEYRDMNGRLTMPQRTICMYTMCEKVREQIARDRVCLVDREQLNLKLECAIRGYYWWEASSTICLYRRSVHL